MIYKGTQATNVMLPMSASRYFEPITVETLVREWKLGQYVDLNEEVGRSREQSP
jgi:hypothetical protein